MNLFVLSNRREIQSKRAITRGAHHQARINRLKIRLLNETILPKHKLMVLFVFWQEE